MHVDLDAVAARDLDLVVALLVLELGGRDATATDGVDRDPARLVERRPGDRLPGAVVLAAVVVAAGHAGDRGAAPPGRGDCGSGDYPLLKPAVHAGDHDEVRMR